MQLTLNTPKQALNKAYLKEKVSRADIDLFKTSFFSFLEKINDKADEEHLKSLVQALLKDAWYKDAFQINPIGKNDLVIHYILETFDCFLQAKIILKHYHIYSNKSSIENR